MSEPRPQLGDHLTSGEKPGTIITAECAICGAEYGTDFDYFAQHVRGEHTSADVGLAPNGEIHPPREDTLLPSTDDRDEHRTQTDQPIAPNP